MPKQVYTCALCEKHIRNPREKCQVGALELNSDHWRVVGKSFDDFSPGSFACAKCRLKVRNAARVKYEKSWIFPEGPRGRREPQALLDSATSQTQSSIDAETESEESEIVEYAEVQNSEGIILSQMNSIEVDVDLYHNSEVSMDSNETQRSTSSSMLSRSNSNGIRISGVKSVGCTENRCFICKSNQGRSRIKAHARIDAWMRTGLYIPANNRTCRDHLTDGLFNEDALKQAKIRCSAKMTPEDISKWFTLLTCEAKKTRKVIDFEPSSDFKTEDYELLLGVSRDDFDSLVLYLKGAVKTSENRSIRNALGMLMIKLRLNLSQKVIALLFGVKSQAVVSMTIDTVLAALEKEFVPKFTGYSHITREDLIQNHMRTYFTNVLAVSSDDLILVLDGTYLFTEKPSEILLQKKTYSLHKHANLFKPMMVVAPSGYIVSADGLYYADNGNTDAEILKAMLRTSDSIRSIMHDEDVLILDRGFRDSIEAAENVGLKTYMPCLLKKGQSQFSTEEANKSRQVSMLRFIVEQVNARLKLRYKFFDHRIPVSYFPKLGRLFQVAVALTNAFRPPLFNEQDIHPDLAERVHSRLHTPNYLQQEVEANSLWRKKTLWEVLNEDDLLEFPELSLEEIRLITLGWYQINKGDLYNREVLSKGDGYKYMYYKQRPGLVFMKLQSRFTKSRMHNVFVDFEEHGKGHGAIKQYYCMCKVGSRTVGCCSHVAAVIRYLGHDRFEPTKTHKNLGQFFLDAAESLADEDNDSDEDEGDETDDD